MKKTILICLLILPSLVGSAQSKYSLEWGEVIPLDSDDNRVEMRELAGGMYFTLEYAAAGTAGKHVTARLYQNGKKVNERKIEFKAETTAFLGLRLRPKMEGLISSGGRDYFLLTEVDTRSKRVHLRAWRFDPPTLTVAEEPLTLASVESLDPVLSTYTWAFSRNRDRMYVLESPGRGPNPAATFTLKTYDQDLTLQSERQYSLPPAIELLQVTGVTLEYGHLVVSAVDYERRPSIWKNPPGFKVFYFIVPNGGQTLQIVPIELPGLQISEAKLVFQGPDEFLCYGLYSKSEREYTPFSAGAFFARYSIKQRRLDAPQIRAFPASIVDSADFRDKRAKARKPGELPNLRVADLRVRPDGGLQFITEQSNNRWSSSTITSYDGSSSVTMSGTVFEFDDILVYTLHRDPSRDWFSLIRKRQQGVGTSHEFSFTHTYDKSGTLWMLYNDLPGNLSLPAATPPVNLKIGEARAGTVLASVDSRGNLHRELIFTKKDVGCCWFTPRQTKYSADGMIQLSAFGKKSYRQGTLRLPR